MGSWAELDAVYPPGALTPATAFVVALGHLASATSVYADAETGALASFMPHPGRGLKPDRDILARAERYLREVDVADFLSEARSRLNPTQLRCLLLNLLDTILASGQRPEDHPRFRLLLEGLGATAEQLQPYRQALTLKNDLTIFPQ